MPGGRENVPPGGEGGNLSAPSEKQDENSYKIFVHDKFTFLPRILARAQPPAYGAFPAGIARKTPKTGRFCTGPVFAERGVYIFFR